MVEVIGWIVICLWVSDLIVATLHHIEDTYCKRGLPFIGELICDPNIDHHHKPAQTFGTFFDRNYIQWTSALVVIFIVYIIWGWVSWQFCLICALSAFANEVHAWQHGVISNKWTKLFFKLGIFQGPKDHDVHHRYPFMNSYCILLNFNNAWMDYFGFWRILEYLIEKIFGIKPIRQANKEIDNLNENFERF